jgi:hypothetical protein
MPKPDNTEYVLQGPVRDSCPGLSRMLLTSAAGVSGGILNTCSISLTVHRSCGAQTSARNIRATWEGLAYSGCRCKCNYYLLAPRTIISRTLLDQRASEGYIALTLPLATDLLSSGFIMYLPTQVSAWKLAEQLHAINGRSSIYFCSLTLVGISSAERIEGFILMRHSVFASRLLLALISR